MQSFRASLTASILLLAATGCATLPPAAHPDSAVMQPPVAAEPPAARAVGERLAQRALAQMGAPYRYGGADPLGFDCSGLVRYVFGQEGLIVPRTALAQQRAAQPISTQELEPGDLLFYRSGAGPVDHVAIYIGDGRMVHAPRSGKVVEERKIDDPWYAQRFIAAGRIAAEP